MKETLDGRMGLWSYTAIMDAECQMKFGLFLLVNLWYGHDAARYGLASSCLGILEIFMTSNVDADRAEHVNGSHSVKHCQIDVASQLRTGKEEQADVRDGQRSRDTNDGHVDCRSVWRMHSLARRQHACLRLEELVSY